MTRQFTPSRKTRAIVAAVLLVTCAMPQLASQAALTTATTDAFMGTGGVSPVPPKAITPTPPTLLRGPWARLVVLKVTGAPFRPVALRSTTGRLLDLRQTDAAGLLWLVVPPEGALLDVLGTDVIGLPVTPGQVLTVITE